MPYTYDPNLDEEKQQQQAQGGPVQISGASPTTDAQGSTSKATPTGSGYQNLDKYLQTNNAQNFGQQVTGKVQGEIDTAKQGQQEASQNFTNKVTTANQTPTQEDINNAVTTPEHANHQQYQTWENQKYQGPKSLEDSQDDWNKYWSGAQKAGTSAKLLGTEPGRFTLLDSYFGRPSYNYGQKSLDNLLVQQGGVGDQSKDLQSQATQLKSQGQEGLNQLQTLAAQKAADVDTSAKNARGAVGVDETGRVVTGDNAGAIGKSWAEVDAELAKENADRQSQNDTLSKGLASNSINQEQIDQLGLTAGDHMWNLNLGNYFTPGQSLDKNQVMTPEQQARIRALESLAGVDDTYANGDLRAKSDPYSFNKAQFSNDQAAAAGTYNREWNTPNVWAPGESAFSMQNAADYINQVKASQAALGRDPNNPATWMGSEADNARDYMNRIAQFNAKYGLGNTLNPAPLVKNTTGGNI